MERYEGLVGEEKTEVCLLALTLLFQVKLIEEINYRPTVYPLCFFYQIPWSFVWQSIKNGFFRADHLLYIKNSSRVSQWDLSGGISKPKY